MRYFSLIAAMLAALSLSACKEEQEQAAPQMGPPPVDVSAPIKKEITEWDEYTGRFEAVERVDIRARVTGYLTEKKFRDGQIVKKGDVLFVIDPRPFEYQAEQSRAQFTLAQKEYRRAQKLRRSQAISQEDLERRLQEYKVAEAQLNDANLDVEFTEVKSPINGRVSEGFVDIGNLVQENQTLLTRVVSIDPIHFEFEASQSQLLKYIRLDRSGKRPGSDENPNPVFIKLQDENRFEHAGRMDFVDNIVDPGTGTIQGRALVPNPDKVIYPGLFGRARLVGSAPYEAILLPEYTIQTDQDRKFVYIVNDQNQATRAYIEVGDILDNRFVPIRSGLTGNERVVVSGVQRIRAPNQPVTPEEKALEWVPIDTVPSEDTVLTIPEMIAQGEDTSRPTSIEESPSEEQ